MSETLSTGLVLVIATAIIGLIVWSVQRIVGRIDRLSAQLNGLGTRVAVIESKQDAQVVMGRKVAAKVGVRVPPVGAES